MVASADPVPQSSYLLQPGSVASGADNHIPSLMLHYCDGGVIILPAGQNCTPVVVSPTKPLPVTIAGGGTAAVPSGATGAPSTTGAAYVERPDGGQLATSAAQPALNPDGGALAHIINLPATQPVSGSVSVSNLPATQPVSAMSLPLPAGAAQDGTDGAPAQPYGGTGIRGWLAAISNQLYYATLKVQLQAGGASQPVTDPATATIAGAVRANDTGTNRTQTHDDTLAAAQAGTGLLTRTASGPGVGGTFGTTPTLGTLRLTCIVNKPGFFRIDTYGSTPVVEQIDDGAGGNVTYALLDPGAGQGRQGTNTAPEMPWFTGRIRLYGDANASGSGRSDGGCS